MKLLQEYSKVVESVGIDVLKFAGTEFALNLKIPARDLDEMKKSMEEIQGIMQGAGDKEGFDFSGVWEKNRIAVRQYEEAQKNTIANLKTVLTGYLETVDEVYKKQANAQRAIFEQMKATGASPEDMKNQAIAVLTAEKTQISTRLDAWQQYYDTLTALHTSAIDEQKRKTQELLALETQISQQRQGYADLEKSLKDKIFNQNKSEVQKYYDTQRSLEGQYQSALLLNGQARIDALAKYQQAAASAANAVVEDGKEYISLQNASRTALDQVKLAQSEIVTEQEKMIAAKQQEIEQTQTWAATLRDAIAEAKAVLGSYKAEIIDLGDRMTSLKLTIDTTQAMGAIQAIKREIETPLVVRFYGEGSEIKPISEKVQDIREMIGSIGDERPNIVANFTPLSEQISQMKSSVTQDMQSMFSNFQLPDFKLEPFQLSKPQFDIGTSKLRQSQEIVSSLNASLMQIASTASLVRSEILSLGAAMQTMRLSADASQVLNQLSMIKTDAEVLIIDVSQALTALNDVKSLMNSIPDVTRKTILIQTVQTGAAPGGNGFQPFSGTSALPSYFVGSRYIDDDRIAELHKGEAVVPARYNIYQNHTFEEVKNIVQNTFRDRENNVGNPGNSQVEIQNPAPPPAEVSRQNIYQNHIFENTKNIVKNTENISQTRAINTENVHKNNMVNETSQSVQYRVENLYRPDTVVRTEPIRPNRIQNVETHGRASLPQAQPQNPVSVPGRNITINIPKIEITARETDSPAMLARKIVKPLQEELRRLKNLQ
ncbi:MAG: hypothetical protein EDM70_09910 [Candidatus Brocadia sp. AMX2]|nr:MAG: hypothetical protein EDM70_09910 [Candidatus Brocadia sp. AMX2]